MRVIRHVWYVCMHFHDSPNHHHCDWVHVQIFDKFLPRLQDSNSKVNLHALRVMEHIVPILKDALHAVIPMATSNLAPNLSSKNREISSTAAEILNSFMQHLGQ